VQNQHVTGIKKLDKLMQTSSSIDHEYE